MNPGIYKLTFANGSVYVGQTQDLDRRRTEHLKPHSSKSPKLRQAFETCGPPEFTILEITPELDAQEKYWIDVLQPDLNVLPGGDGMRGLNHPRTQYTKAQIEEVVRLYTTTATKITDIAHITGVHHSTCHDVLKRRSHLWATEGIDLKPHERTTVKVIYDPLGNKFEANTFQELEDKTGIPKSSLDSIINSKGGRGRNGWTAYPPTVATLTDPLGNETTATLQILETIVKENDCLSPYQLRKLFKEFKPTAGWKITVCP